MRTWGKWLVLLCCILGLVGCDGISIRENPDSSSTQQTISYEGKAENYFGKWSGQPYAVLNDNQPEFKEEEFIRESFESYSELDSLGRCGTAYANIGKELMPVEERGAIGQIKPAGWHTIKYDCVDGKYLYNRCHLIGYQLTGENANERNLITGTRYLNVEGMLPFENLVADYVKETSNHVLYRVTPVYEGKNLLATGLQMEACSVEDEGEGVCYNVFVYNIQPGIVLDYATGESWEDDTEETQNSSEETKKSNTNLSSQETYILNTRTKKFHLPECSSTEKISKNNKEEYTGTKDELESKGYEACKVCQP